MTIKKTYQLQVVYADDAVDLIERKALTPAAAKTAAEQEFPNAHHVCVTGRKNDPKWRRYHKRYVGMPIFPYKGARFADFVYHHKGRPVKGRRAMPKLSYYDRPAYAIFKVTHGAPITKLLKDWIGVIAQDLPIQVPA